MSNEEALLDVLLDRLADSGLSIGQQTLVWAAFEGDEELRQALSGDVGLPRSRAAAEVREVEQPHAYLQTITVRGFRGVGQEASLRLAPSPGLTLVVGRNGSGKSSFAEGVEVALTGTSYRWKDKTKDWRGGWRNLHHGADTMIELELVVDGDRGRTTVCRTWTGADVDRSQAWVQRPGLAREPLSALGWDAALTTYRPFLSYSELGQTIAGKPSEMYDAIAAILGLERISDAEQRLNDVRKELDAAVKDLDRELQPLLAELKSIDDDRAREASIALSGRRRDLATAKTLAEGTGPDPSTEIDTLRLLMQISHPDLDAVAEAVLELRSAAQAASAVRGTAADDSRHTADLLQRALEHHERHADQQTCPVCGTRDVLDDSWASQTRARIDELRRAAKDADDAARRVRVAVASAAVAGCAARVAACRIGRAHRLVRVVRRRNIRRPPATRRPPGEQHCRVGCRLRAGPDRCLEAVRETRRPLAADRPPTRRMGRACRDRRGAGRGARRRQEGL